MINNDNNEQEESLLCPITHEIMVDPVLVADGFSYERNGFCRKSNNYYNILYFSKFINANF